MRLMAQATDLGNCGRLNYNGGRRSTKPVIVMVMVVVRLIIGGFQTTPFNQLSIWNSLVDQAAVVACESSGPPCFDRSRGRNELI